MFFSRFLLETFISNVDIISNHFFLNNIPALSFQMWKIFFSLSSSPSRWKMKWDYIFLVEEASTYLAHWKVISFDFLLSWWKKDRKSKLFGCDRFDSQSMKAKKKRKTSSWKTTCPSAGHSIVVIDIVWWEIKGRSKNRPLIAMATVRHHIFHIEENAADWNKDVYWKRTRTDG